MISNSIYQKPVPINRAYIYIYIYLFIYLFFWIFLSVKKFIKKRKEKEKEIYMRILNRIPWTQPHYTKTNQVGNHWQKENFKPPWNLNQETHNNMWE